MCSSRLSRVHGMLSTLQYPMGASEGGGGLDGIGSRGNQKEEETGRRKGVPAVMGLARACEH